MSKLQLTRRKYILLSLAAVLAVMAVVFVYIEVNASRSDLLASKNAEATTVVEMFARTSRSSIAANDLLEELIVRYLLSSTRLLHNLEHHRTLDREFLTELASQVQVNLLAVTDTNGFVTASNIPFRTDDASLSAVFDSIRYGGYSWMAIPNAGYGDDDSRFYLLVMRSDKQDSYLVAGFREDVILEYRRSTGIGVLLQDLGANPDIRYVVVQDLEGILTASHGITSMSSIDADSFLQKAYNTDTAYTRIIDYAGSKTLEVVRSIRADNGLEYLARIGISLNKVQTIQQRSMKRVILIGAAFVAIGVLVLGFLFTRERFTILKAEHRRVMTSTDLILDNIADGVVALDAEGRQTFSNAIARDILSTEGSVSEYDPVFLIETLKMGIPIPYRERKLVADSKQLVLGISTSIIRDDDGSIEAVIAIIRDLTEEKRITEQLHRRERLSALGELAGGVAHEIRNPLNAISIIAQRLKGEFEPTSDSVEYNKLTTTVRSEVERVNDIVKQFLSFARPPKLQLETLHFQTVVSEAIDVIESQAKSANVKIELSVQELMYVKLDRNVFKQALINIFQNALDAMPGGGNLNIQVYKDGNAVLRIEDSGSGISPEVQAKMFNLYYSTKSTGTGLGLSIVHQIVSEHNGEITVESVPQKGAAFIITLPISDD